MGVYMNNIAVEQLKISFQGDPILQGISFEAEEGSVTSILGNSGAGKTTLFRILCGLETADSGKVILNNKKIGLIFQQFYLWQHMTVLENLILAPMQVLKSTKQEAIQKAQALLLMLGVNAKIHAYPAVLSGGEQQRIAIARSLMMDPDVLLFDEPTSSLDPESTELIANIIQTLAKQGKIILIITHDVPFASKVSNTILFLKNGTIAEKTTCENGCINSQIPRFKAFLKNVDDVIEI